VADFRDAVKRYVPKADVDARREDMYHRIRLQTEALAEDEKECSRNLAKTTAMPPAPASDQNVTGV
jgi:hypothetical protein